jgi:ADP-ribosylglycohydrolase
MVIDETKMMLKLACNLDNQKYLDKLTEKEIETWYNTFRTRTDNLVEQFNKEFKDYLKNRRTK